MEDCGGVFRIVEIACVRAVNAVIVQYFQSKKKKYSLGVC